MTIQSLTSDERRGFLHACDCLALWAAQIERNASGLSGSGETVSLDEMMANGARMTRGLADALRIAARANGP